MKTSLNTKLALLLVTSLTLSASNLSSDAKEGESHYLDAKCQQCHNKGMDYVPKGSKATDYSKLQGWVSSCASHFNIDWFPEDEANVVKYLNEIYYDYKH
jgi:hypothetical protein